MNEPKNLNPAGRRNTRMTGTIEFRGIIGDAVSELGVRIVGGDWAPGDALPREADLTEMMGVGRSVVREALRILGATKAFSRPSESGATFTRHFCPE